MGSVTKVTSLSGRYRTLRNGYSAGGAQQWTAAAAATAASSYRRCHATRRYLAPRASPTRVRFGPPPSTRSWHVSGGARVSEHPVKRRPTPFLDDIVFRNSSAVIHSASRLEVNRGSTLPNDV